MAFTMTITPVHILATTVLDQAGLEEQLCMLESPALQAVLYYGRPEWDDEPLDLTNDEPSSLQAVVDPSAGPAPEGTGPVTVTFTYNTQGQLDGYLPLRIIEWHRAEE